MRRFLGIFFSQGSSPKTRTFSAFQAHFQKICCIELLKEAPSVSFYQRFRTISYIELYMHLFTYTQHSGSHIIRICIHKQMWKCNHKLIVCFFYLFLFLIGQNLCALYEFVSIHSSRSCIPLSIQIIQIQYIKARIYEWSLLLQLYYIYYLHHINFVNFLIWSAYKFVELLVECAFARKISS